MSRKKTPMFVSSIPSAYDFVDFTSPGGNNALSSLGRPVNEMKGSDIVNEPVQNSREYGTTAESSGQKNNNNFGSQQSQFKSPFKKLTATVQSTGEQIQKKQQNVGGDSSNHPFEVYESGPYISMTKKEPLNTFSETVPEKSFSNNLNKQPPQVYETNNKFQAPSEGSYQFKSSFQNDIQTSQAPQKNTLPSYQPINPPPSQKPEMFMKKANTTNPYPPNQMINSPTKLQTQPPQQNSPNNFKQFQSPQFQHTQPRQQEMKPKGSFEINSPVSPKRNINFGYQQQQSPNQPPNQFVPQYQPQSQQHPPSQPIQPTQQQFKMNPQIGSGLEKKLSNDLEDKFQYNTQKNDIKAVNPMLQSTPARPPQSGSSSESGLTDESFLDLLPEPTRSNLKAILQRSKNQKQ